MITAGINPAANNIPGTRYSPVGRGSPANRVRESCSMKPDNQNNPAPIIKSIEVKALRALVVTMFSFISGLIRILLCRRQSEGHTGPIPHIAGDLDGAAVSFDQ